MVPCNWTMATQTEKNQDKKHGRKEISLFRYGLVYLRQILLKLHENWLEFYTTVRKAL